MLRIMQEKKVNLVVAMCNNRGIGVNGKLPWQLRKDMEFFKTVTKETESQEKQNAVIMGRKTFYSIPEKFRPLQKRINIILSREMKDPPEGVHLVNNLREAFQLVNSGSLRDQVESVFVIGGASVYKEAIESCEQCTMYLTRVLADIDCDTFLPEFENKFEKVDNPPSVPEGKFNENGLDFVFETYKKTPKS